MGGGSSQPPPSHPPVEEPAPSPETHANVQSRCHAIRPFLYEFGHRRAMQRPMLRSWRGAEVPVMYTVRTSSAMEGGSSLLPHRLSHPSAGRLAQSPETHANVQSQNRCPAPTGDDLCSEASSDDDDDDDDFLEREMASRFSHEIEHSSSQPQQLDDNEVDDDDDDGDFFPIFADHPIGHVWGMEAMMLRRIRHRRRVAEAPDMYTDWTSSAMGGGFSLLTHWLSHSLPGQLAQSPETHANVQSQSRCPAPTGDDLCAEASSDDHHDFVPHFLEREMGQRLVITERLEDWDDLDLLRLTEFYRDRLEQAMERGVHGLSSALTFENHLSGREHWEITELADQEERADSSKFLLKLVMSRGPQACRVMWKSFVKMRNAVPKLDRLLKEIQEHGSVPFVDISTVVDIELRDVQQKHKETLRAQTETLRVNTILKMEVKVFQLVDLYAELTMISSVQDRRLVEHELLARGRDHEECREKCLQRELEKIRTDQLFYSCFFWNRSGIGSSAAVTGAPGIGKTTMVQKIVHDWATGKIYQHFQFVFSFRFRDLNSIKSRVTLKELILEQYPYFGNSLSKVWKNPAELLFIFDGLDEFNGRIDFADSRRDTEPKHQCPDPEWWCEVSDIVYSLIQHKLLPGCSVLVITRPTALHLLEKAEISAWAEILGFVGEERKKCFTSYFEDQTVAAAVYKHMEENEILYTMSYNPSYCCILGLALGPFFTQTHRDTQQVPKTTTQLYCYFIYNILKNHGREIESPREVLLRLGQMAFAGVAKKKIVFTDGDLIKYNLQPSQFLSGFLIELLEKDSARSVVYTFPHLIIQEFVAALAQFLTPRSKNILKLLTKALSAADGQFEVFLRFVAGLSSPGSARGLEEILGPFSHQTTCRVIDWVKEVVKSQAANARSEAGKRSLLNTVHYLFESHNPALIQQTLGCVETLSFSGLRLTPNDCSILSRVIGFCDTVKHIDLERCYIRCEGLERLGPGLHKCQELRLGSNDLGDSGVKLVTAALRNPRCKIQKLTLGNNRLTESSAKDLTSALSTYRSLTVVDLGNNKLGAAATLVFTALMKPNCKIQTLWLRRVGLTDSSIGNLACALSANCSLRGLDLGENSFTDRSIPILHTIILTLPSLEWIWLEWNRFSSNGKEKLKCLQKCRPGLCVSV